MLVATKTATIENFGVKDVSLKRESEGLFLVGNFIYDDEFYHGGMPHYNFKINLSDIEENDLENELYLLTKADKIVKMPKNYEPPLYKKVKDNVDYELHYVDFYIHEVIKPIILNLHKNISTYFSKEIVEHNGYQLVRGTALAQIQEELEEEVKSLEKLASEASASNEKSKANEKRIEQLGDEICELFERENTVYFIQFVLLLTVVKEMEDTYAKMNRLYPNQYSLVAVPFNLDLLCKDNNAEGFSVVTGVPTKITDHTDFLSNIEKIKKRAESQLNRPVLGYFGYNERFDFNLCSEDVGELFKP